MRTIVAFLCALVLVSAGRSQTAQPMPHIEGQNLRDRKIVLPDASLGKAAVLVLGFTKASKEQTSAWEKWLARNFSGRSDMDIYQMPVLEDLPRLIRGMVISSIRKGVAENERDHFVILVQGEEELKKRVGYKEADDAYLIVLDQRGQITYQTHGAVNADRSAELEKYVGELTKRK